MATTSEALAEALLHHHAGRLQEAEQIYRQILAADAGNARAWHLLGVVAYQAGKHEEAIELIRRSIALDSGDAEAFNALGLALRSRGNLNDAIANYRRTLELQPDFAEAHNNLGLALQQAGMLSEAIVCFLQATRLKPNYARAFCNLGNALDDAGKHDDSISLYRRALELAPDFPEAHYNLGVAFEKQAKWIDAIASYRQAVELKADFADAHWNLSRLALLTGDFEQGWPEYEWRWNTGQLPKRTFLEAKWDGQPLNGRSILLYAEQGLGDTLQFIRYAPLVKNLGGTVLVECQEPLVQLISNCPGIDRLLCQGEELPGFDFHAPLISLPGIFKTAQDNVHTTYHTCLPVQR
jgi:tetratricopeptide (TPR) repeat protein